MDRDVWLILIGAGIAFASNIVMRFLEFLVRLIARKLYFVYTNRRYEKALRQKLMGIEPNSEQPDFWSELLTDIARLRGGGGEKPGLNAPVDYVFLALQWIVTVGAFALWYFRIMPQLK